MLGVAGDAEHRPSTAGGAEGGIDLSFGRRRALVIDQGGTAESPAQRGGDAAGGTGELARAVFVVLDRRRLGR